MRPAPQTHTAARALGAPASSARKRTNGPRTIGRTALGLAATFLLMVGCALPPEPQSASTDLSASMAGHASAAAGQLTDTQRQAIAQVLHATARYHDIAVAQGDGYTTQYPAGCSESPLGAQGFHYLNTALVDATVELLRPELVMYEPQPDGSLQLIGVDYVVPLSASEAPPTLLGVPFGRNEALGVWALHIWAWRPNPRGMFAMWNPNASCEFAG